VDKVVKNTTIRIKARSHQALKEIAALTGRSVQEELDQAIEERRRRLYLEGLNQDYAALAADPKALADFRRETTIWDATTSDGLNEL
jgi:hypothetical protein